MKTQLAWIFGGGSVVALGLLTTVGGCSSTGNGNDAGTDVTTAQDTGKDTQNTNDVANDQEVQDSGADCKTVPSDVPFETDAANAIYCPFQESSDGGELFGPCGRGNHCCDYTSGSNPSTCLPLGTACPFEAGTNADLQCEESADCQNGVCCMTGASLGMDQGCSYFFASKNHGTACVTGSSCGGTSPQICGQTADCTTGTCQPIYTLGVWLGVCQ